MYTESIISAWVRLAMIIQTNIAMLSVATKNIYKLETSLEHQGHLHLNTLICV